MIFASAKHVVGQHSESSETPETSRQVPDMSAEGHQRRPLENGSDSPEAKKARLMSPMMAPAPDTQAPMDEMDRQVIDLASQRHGPKFVALNQKHNHGYSKSIGTWCPETGRVLPTTRM